MKKRGILLLLIIFILPIVSGANIGVTPATIHFKNVLRGGYAERSVIISVDSENPIKISLTTRGEIKDWLNFSSLEFEVNKSSPYRLKVSVNPPEDIPNGNYTGFIKLTASQDTKAAEGHATGAVIASLDLYTIVEITDIEYFSCKATNFKVESAEKGDPIIFSLDVYNGGNIRIKPRIKIDIWDQEQINLVKEVEFSETEIIPTTKKKVIIEVDSGDMELGQYWADVSAIDCYSSSTLTFDVLEPGALKASGILEKIITNPWINEEETTMIQAVFKNNGEKTVRAQFKGKINKGNKIIQILESEKILVPIDNSTTFNFYFTPKEKGKYIVSGRVFYEGKRTYEKSAVINVKPSGFKLSSLFIPLIYLILIILIAFMLYKINKEKRILNNKMRALK